MVVASTKGPCVVASTWRSSFWWLIWTLSSIGVGRSSTRLVLLLSFIVFWYFFYYPLQARSVINTFQLGGLLEIKITIGVGRSSTGLVWLLSFIVFWYVFFYYLYYKMHLFFSYLSLKNFIVKRVSFGVVMRCVTFWKISWKMCEWGQNMLKSLVLICGVSYWF